MASPDADASPRARSQWQRAVSAVAARDGTDAGPPSSDFSSVAAEATFVRRLNSRKSFSAAFGRRSLSGKVVKIVDDAELSRDAAPRSTAPRSSAPASPPPAARRLSGDLASRPDDVVTLEGIALANDGDEFNMYEATAPYARRTLLTPRTAGGRALLRAAFLSSGGRRALRQGLKLPRPWRWRPWRWLRKAA